MTDQHIFVAWRQARILQLQYSAPEDEARDAAEKERLVADYKALTGGGIPSETVLLRPKTRRVFKCLPGLSYVPPEVYPHVKPELDLAVAGVDDLSYLDPRQLSTFEAESLCRNSSSRSSLLIWRTIDPRPEIHEIIDRTLNEKADRYHRQQAAALAERRPNAGPQNFREQIADLETS